MMMEGLQHHLPVANATREAMAWAASPLGVLIRVEVLVTVSCCLLATLVCLCSLRRTSPSPALRLVVWLALMLSYPAVSYTIGLMQSDSFRNDLVVVWACFLLGCADRISACSADGSDQQARTLLSQATQVVYVVLLLVSYINSLQLQLKILMLLFWLLNVAKLGMRRKSILSSRTLFVDNLVISNYMAQRQYVRESTWDFDPGTMKGYKYVVAGEENLQDLKGAQKLEAMAGHATGKKNVQDAMGALNLEGIDHLVTVERVWQCEQRLLSKGNARSGRLKDLCLSLALFKLLWRRLDEGCPLDERDDVRTLVFVHRGLAGGEHERMFRVIEVELGFLFDLCYGRYPSVKQTLVPETATFVAAVALSLSILFSSTFRRYHDHRSNTGFITTGLDIWLTRLVIVQFLTLEMFQYLSLVLSDWFKVKMTCRYVRDLSWHGHPVMEKILWLMSRATLTSRYWSNSVGQYSILHSCFQNQRSSLLRMPLHRWIKDRMVEAKRVTRPSLLVSVKQEIHKLLQSDWLCYIKYGDRTLQRNDLLPDLDWATSRYAHGAIGNILISHIATTVCDAQRKSKRTAAGGTCRARPVAGGSGSSVSDSGHEVATTRSSYCAYLLFQAPELVTDKIFHARSLMEALHRRIQQYIQGCCAMDEMFQKLSEFVPNTEESAEEEVILADGIRLSQRIQEKIQEEGLLWTVLAEMWVELLLTVTPSDDVTSHVKRLATGGELITHLWPLLTHGGVIDKPKTTDYAQGYS